MVQLESRIREYLKSRKKQIGKIVLASGLLLGGFGFNGLERYVTNKERLSIRPTCDYRGICVGDETLPNAIYLAITGKTFGVQRNRLLLGNTLPAGFPLWVTIRPGNHSVFSQDVNGDFKQIYFGLDGKILFRFDGDEFIEDNNSNFMNSRCSPPIRTSTFYKDFDGKISGLDFDMYGPEISPGKHILNFEILYRSGKYESIKRVVKIEGDKNFVPDGVKEFIKSHLNYSKYQDLRKKQSQREERACKS